MPEILVDQAVAKKYFDKEVDFFKQHQDISESRGWKVERIYFPFFEISFLLPTNRGDLKYLTLRFNLMNFNILPMSVEVIYPDKFILGPNSVIIGATDKIIRKIQITPGKNVLLIHHKTKKPFICMKGIYEYHIHSQHEKTYWDVFRYSDFGSLFYFVNAIWEGSTKKVRGFVDLNLRTKDNLFRCLDPVMI